MHLYFKFYISFLAKDTFRFVCWTVYWLFLSDSVGNCWYFGRRILCLLSYQCCKVYCYLFTYTITCFCLVQWFEGASSAWWMWKCRSGSQWDWCVICHIKILLALLVFEMIKAGHLSTLLPEWVISLRFISIPLYLILSVCTWRIDWTP